MFLRRFKPGNIVQNRDFVPRCKPVNLFDHLLISIASFPNPYPMKLTFQIIDVLTLYSRDMLGRITLAIPAMTILAVLLIDFFSVFKVKPRTNAVIRIHRQLCDICSDIRDLLRSP